MKTCTKCGAEKPLSSFHNDKNRKDKKTPWCKTCVANHHTSTRAVITAQDRRWRAANRDRLVPKKREYDRVYRQTNKNRLRVVSLAKRARIKSLPSERVTVKQVAIRDGAWCWLCGDELSDFDPSHMDHLIPISADPDLLAIWGVDNPGTVLANMALACPSCNFRKSNKILPCAIARYLRNLEPIEATA